MPLCRSRHNGKKINGRKWHIAVDAVGLLGAVVVTAASVQGRDGACPLLATLRERFSTITLVWADGGYTGRLVIWAAAVLRLTVTVVKRCEDTLGFVVLPRRWGLGCPPGLRSLPPPATSDPPAA